MVFLTELRFTFGIWVLSTQVSLDLCDLNKSHDEKGPFDTMSHALIQTFAYMILYVSRDYKVGQ